MATEKISLKDKTSCKDLLKTSVDMFCANDKYCKFSNYALEPHKLANTFVKEDYSTTENLDDFEKHAEMVADKKASIRSLIVKAIFFVAYIVFLVTYPMITQVAIEDGWIFAIPLLLLVLIKILHACGKHGGDKGLYIATGCAGGLLPVLCIFAAVFEAEVTGKGDTACLIAYFIAVVPAVIIPPLFMSKNKFLKAIKKKDKYNEGVALAMLMDVAIAEQARQKDEERFKEYVAEYTATREKMLPQIEEATAEWSVYKDVYEYLETKAYILKGKVPEITLSIENIMKAIAANLEELDEYGEISSLIDMAFNNCIRHLNVEDRF